MPVSWPIGPPAASTPGGSSPERTRAKGRNPATSQGFRPPGLRIRLKSTSQDLMLFMQLRTLVAVSALLFAWAGAAAAQESGAAGNPTTLCGQPIPAAANLP